MHVVRMGGATLVSPFLMFMLSTSLSLRNTGGHPYCPYECPTVLANNCGEDGLAHHRCHICKVTGALVAHTPLPTHLASIGANGWEKTALTIGETKLWTPPVSETTNAASTSPTARRDRQRRTHDNNNHRHTVHKSRCTASACASSSAAAPVGAPARAPRFSRSLRHSYVFPDSRPRAL